MFKEYSMTQYSILRREDSLPPPRFRDAVVKKGSKDNEAPAHKN